MRNVIGTVPFGMALSNLLYRIKHGFSCLRPRFQHLPRDLANVNALKKHVRSLLLHKN